MIAFIGVRISWLMFARKLLLASLAESAASLATCSSATSTRMSSSALRDSRNSSSRDFSAKSACRAATVRGSSCRCSAKCSLKPRWPAVRRSSWRCAKPSIAGGGGGSSVAAQKSSCAKLVWLSRPKRISSEGASACTCSQRQSCEAQAAIGVQRAASPSTSSSARRIFLRASMLALPPRSTSLPMCATSCISAPRSWRRRCPGRIAAPGCGPACGPSPGGRAS